MSEIKRTERGWPAHFIGAASCMFRRNTLIEYSGGYIIVSTVGNYHPSCTKKIETIGRERYYETMVFEGEEQNNYIEVLVTKIINFESKWSIDHCKETADLEADEMHEKVVKELIDRIEHGEVVTGGEE
jgi:hypothetical protein